MHSTIDPLPYRLVEPLFAGSIATICDVTCTCPRSPCGPVRHAHAYELVFVRAGVFLKHHSTTLHRELAAQPAHVLFFRQGESYRVSHPTSRGNACTIIAYSADTVRSLAAKYQVQEGASESNEFPSAHAVLPPSAVLKLQQLRLRLRANALRASDASASDEAHVETEVLELLRVALRAARSSRLRVLAAPSIQISRAADITETVKEALARHPFETTSLQDLATYIGISPFYLARIFSREVGLPIHQYLLRLRLMNAVERMSDISLNLSTIAVDCGFSSGSHFTTAFRKLFGTTPTQWRRQALCGCASHTQGNFIHSRTSAPSSVRQSV